MNNEEFDKKVHWQCSFDLKMDKLDEFYKKSHSNAYKEIERFLFKAGFNNKDEKQGSCYFTSEPMKYHRVDKIIRDMLVKLPWLSECVSRISVSEKRVDDYNYLKVVQRIRRSSKHKEALEKYHKSLKPKAKFR